jgi:hypothetical protein
MRTFYRRAISQQSKKKDQTDSKTLGKKWLRHKLPSILLITVLSSFVSCKDSKPQFDDIDKRPTSSHVEKNIKTSKQEKLTKIDAGEQAFQEADAGASPKDSKSDATDEKVLEEDKCNSYKEPFKYVLGPTEQEVKLMERIYAKACKAPWGRAIKIYEKGLDSKSACIRAEMQFQFNELFYDISKSTLDSQSKVRLLRKLYGLFERLLHDPVPIIRGDSLYTLNGLMVEKITDPRMMKHGIYSFGLIYLNWSDKVTHSPEWAYGKGGAPLKRDALYFFAEHLEVDDLEFSYGVTEVMDQSLMNFAIKVFERALTKDDASTASLRQLGKQEELLSVTALINLAKDKKTKPATKKKIDRILAKTASKFLKEESNKSGSSSIESIKLITDYFEKMRKTKKTESNP